MTDPGLCAGYNIGWTVGEVNWAALALPTGFVDVCLFSFTNNLLEPGLGRDYQTVTHLCADGSVDVLGTVPVPAEV